MLYKTLLILCFTTTLSARILIDEDFSGTSFPPPNWYRSGDGGGLNWQLHDNVYAGGTAPEVCFTYQEYYFDGVDRLVCGPINTTNYRNLELTFKYTLPYYSISSHFDFAVQVWGSNGQWTTVWFDEPIMGVWGETVTIPIDNTILDTSSFRFAFAIIGRQPLSTVAYVDDVVLTAGLKLATGTWHTGDTEIVDIDMEVPAGETLIIEPGVNVQISGEHDIVIHGVLEANGTAEQPVVIAPQNPGMGQGHLLFENATSAGSTLSHCHFSYLWPPQGTGFSDHGGAVAIVFGSDVSFDHCRFEDNYADDEGGAVRVHDSSASFQYCKFLDNTAGDKGGHISASQADITIENTLFYGGSAAYGGGFYFTGENSCLFDQCTLVHNLAPGFTGDIYVTPSGGNQLNLSFINTIRWNGDSNFITSSIPTGLNISLSYCDIDDYANLMYGSCDSLFTEGVFEDDPLFTNAPALNFTLTPNSPCIDAGHPDTLDPDWTIADVGCFYYDQSKPEITAIQDVPNDQGHQVTVTWNASTRDVGVDATAAYIIQRMDSTWVDAVTVSADTSLVYSCPALTLADSCSSGANETAFRVVFTDANGSWGSAAVNGYSVDNIPPDAVDSLGIVCEESVITLSWTAVTTGTWQGDSLPELNGVRYRVYAGEQPDFLCEPASLLGTTQETGFTVSPAENRVFFVVKADDEL